ncbi:hypothetical protein [Paenibacillus radicis (ex Xue et al. 2023)]|uniref:Uncharacterized protein n=1 Tax=Paenibacillus radicis (ex Xue et al. 2023) TaxID=2972489 RepID=A0ABT1YUC6_9BACL|nr:hypothetical protein [Paenibacillus radicis (ex Xue et al. 2023)]MCR8636029.1 hypothetical protein [Paenibacillus radicis (ex Xue et al. 2023)]
MNMRVNRNQLIAGLIMVPLLLSGCGSKPAANEAASVNANGGSAPASQGQGKDQQQAGDQKSPAGSRSERTPMNENEMRLRTISQSLITIDKTDGLAFTKQQAEQLLPLAEAAVAKKELTAEQQDAMLKILTAEQTKLYQSRADQMKQRMSGAGGAGSAGTDSNGAPSKGTVTQEQRDAMKEQRQAQGGSQNPGNGKDGARMQNPGNGGAGGQGAGGPGGGGANAAQQLVDLLKAKVK